MGLLSGRGWAREKGAGGRGVSGLGVPVRFSDSCPRWSDSMPDRPTSSTPPHAGDATGKGAALVIHGPRLRERLLLPGTGKWQVLAPRCASPPATSME